MDGCPNTKDITIFGKNQSEQTALIFNPRCKMWSCEYCAEINRDYWIQQAFRGATIILSEQRKIQFVTLTSRGYATKASSLYFFKQNWPKLNRRIKYHTSKQGGGDFDYLLVPEHHKSGVAHFHLLAVTTINTESSWKHHAWQTGFGYKVDCQPCYDAGGASGYVSKYIGKGMGTETWPKGFMRVRHSRGWPMVDDLPLPGWTWDHYANPDTVWIEKNALLNLGWEVLDKTSTSE